MSGSSKGVVTVAFLPSLPWPHLSSRMRHDV